MQLPNAAAIAADVDAAMADATCSLTWVDPERAPSGGGSSPGTPQPERQRSAEPMGPLLVSPELFSVADLLALARHSAGATLLRLDSALQVLRARVGPEEAAAGAPPRVAAAASCESVGAEPLESPDALGDAPAEVPAALRAAEGALRAFGASGGDEEGGSGDDAEVEAVIAEALRSS